jgi:hypothetical protein
MFPQAYLRPGKAEKPGSAPHPQDSEFSTDIQVVAFNDTLSRNLIVTFGKYGVDR